MISAFLYKSDSKLYHCNLGYSITLQDNDPHKIWPPLPLGDDDEDVSRYYPHLPIVESESPAFECSLSVASELNPSPFEILKQGRCGRIPSLGCATRFNRLEDAD